MSNFELPKSATRKPTSGPAIEKQSAKSKAAEIQPEIEKDADASAPKTKSKWSQEELLKVFDEILFNGEYYEDVTIKGRLHVRFRTRSADEIGRITSEVDSFQANLVSTLNEKRNILNLHYSLLSYQGRDLSGMPIADRAEFIGNIPAPIVGMLMKALGEFDQKVFEACQEGEVNF